MLLDQLLLVLQGNLLLHLQHELLLLLLLLLLLSGSGWDSEVA